MTAVALRDHHPGGPEPVEPELGDQLVRLLRLTNAVRATLLSTQQGQSRVSRQLLFPLLHGGPLRLGALADEVHTDASTASRHVGELLRLGLVTRQPDPEDGRASLLALTPAGVLECEQIRTVRTRLLDEITADWPPGDRSTLASLLLRLNTGLAAATLTGACPAAASPPGTHPITPMEAS